MMRTCRQWRHRIPARVSEFLAAVSLATTLVLFVHTSNLQNQIQLYEMQMDPLSGSHSNSRGSLLISQQSVSNRAILDPKVLDRLNLQQSSKLDARSLNITGGDRKLTLVFNRVPKVGSQSTMALLRALSYLNGFTFHKDRPQKTESIKLSLREQRRLAQLVNTFRPPTVYAKHVCYINFTVFNYTQPIYVNMVRDPVERAISWYYYVRAPWYFVERKQAFPDLPLPSPAWLRKDYETCVRNNDTECRYEEGNERPDFAQLTEFFCGQDVQCTGFNTEYAMKKAKENVEKHYAVVGVLENMNMTLTVLEHYLPRFFKGAKFVYWDQSKKFSHVNKNIYKPKVDNSVKDIVRKSFWREIEFYEFCRQRLYKQYLALNLP